MHSVGDVANYILAKYQSVSELQVDPMTHMKLQKLVYYAQGFSLVVTDEPLFRASIEAWEHGPVCPALYRAFSKFKGNPITTSLTLDEARQGFTDQQLGAMDTVIGLLGDYNASQLRRLSHADEAWQSAFKSADKRISLKSLKESCVPHLTVTEPQFVEMTPDELEYEMRLDDELGIPDSLDSLYDED
jgi:uncharacterized phage-associated protein